MFSFLETIKWEQSIYSDRLSSGWFVNAAHRGVSASGHDARKLVENRGKKRADKVETDQKRIVSIGKFGWKSWVKDGWESRNGLKANHIHELHGTGVGAPVASGCLHGRLTSGRSSSAHRDKYWRHLFPRPTLKLSHTRKISPRI